MNYKFHKICFVFFENLVFWVNLVIGLLGIKIDLPDYFY